MVSMERAGRETAAGPFVETDPALAPARVSHSAKTTEVNLIAGQQLESNIWNGN